LSAGLAQDALLGNLQNTGLGPTPQVNKTNK
jgi:hypothetical protein